MRFADIDLSKLPAPDAIKSLSFEDQLQEMKTELIALGDELEIDLREVLEVEASLSLKLLQVFAARELLVRADGNDQVKAVLPAFAVGDDLKHLAARNGVEQKVTFIEGEDGEDDQTIYEDDEDLRARMQLALEAFSTAGPHGAYLFHLLAIEGVKNGEIYGHEDGLTDGDENELLAPAEILAIVLADNESGLADAELIAEVKDYLSAKERRPLGDRVMIEAAEIVEYQIDVTLKVLGGPDAALIETTALESLTEYTERNFNVARAHRRTGIAAAAHVDGGVDEVILISPENDILPDYNQAARCTTINITMEIVSGGWNV